ncbi:MAG: helix-turn-helix transcriptional regulator [Elusimicrobia bacterium]|nr:helix-turn-helix transcriptional regulator [Elusimicrobiota bacterium]
MNPLDTRTGSPSIQNTNLVTDCLTYSFETELDLLTLNPAYPRKPRTLGEHIRKARMDRRLMIKELAVLVGVSEDTVINWEKRGVQPAGSKLERVREALGIC